MASLWNTVVVRSTDNKDSHTPLVSGTPHRGANVTGACGKAQSSANGETVFLSSIPGRCHLLQETADCSEMMSGAPT
jgi:hypothetical protein